MEEQHTETPQQDKGMGTYVIPAAVIVIIAIAAIYFYVNNTTSSSSSMTQVTTAPQSTKTTSSTSAYKDGEYEVTGDYVSPGGPRDIGVTITLKDGVITDSVFEGRAKDPTSKRFQGEFGDNYKAMVIGKNIDEVHLTKVSGSSLTPKGFADALEKIKTQAKS